MKFAEPDTPRIRPQLKCRLLSVSNLIRGHGVFQSLNPNAPKAVATTTRIRESMLAGIPMKKGKILTKEKQSAKEIKENAAQQRGEKNVKEGEKLSGKGMMNGKQRRLCQLLLNHSSERHITAFPNTTSRSTPELPSDFKFKCAALAADRSSSAASGDKCRHAMSDYLENAENLAALGCSSSSQHTGINDSLALADRTRQHGLSALVLFSLYSGTRLQRICG
ncbi:hypothetical protein C8R45DRAFT_1084111 [Mycena sanguinolenta]|nr:hypothetical protein C8R45DRAFT_1084111 [Mycena sanguinolenta]